MATGRKDKKKPENGATPRPVGIGDVLEVNQGVIDSPSNHNLLPPKGSTVIVSGTYSNSNKLTVQRDQSYNTALIVPRNYCTLLTKPSKNRFKAFTWDKTNPNSIATRNGTMSGSDPEIFVEDSSGLVIPAWKFLPPKNKVCGTWAFPRIYTEGSTNDLAYSSTIKPTSYSCRAFYDGFQAEFTTSPGGCHDGQVIYIRDGLAEVLIAARKLDPAAKLTHKCVVEIPFEMMQKTSDEHAALGCAPSLNIYDESPLDGVDARAIGIRFAGCHMHMGGVLAPPAVKRVVKGLDAIFGVMMVSLLQGLEDPRRRIFYGKAGEYRLPAHGLEYRVPSSAVLVHPVVTYLCFDFARQVRTCALVGQTFQWEAKEQEVREVVDNLDVKGAKRILARNSTFLTHLLRRVYANPRVSSAALGLIVSGAKDELPTESVEENWDLGVQVSSKGFRVSSWAEARATKAQVVVHSSSSSMPAIGISTTAF